MSNIRGVPPKCTTQGGLTLGNKGWGHLVWYTLAEHPVDIYSICFTSNHLKIDMVDIFKNQPLEIPSCKLQLLTCF